MVLLRLAPHALKLPNVRARPENSKRLTRVLKFFRDERAQQYLKRLSLCLQLTGIATSTTGCDSGLAQDNDGCPLSVQLAQGRNQVATCSR